MKKTMVLLALFMLIAFPTVTYASWWNPFTWFNNWTFSSRADIKNQELDISAKKLENKEIVGGSGAVMSDKKNEPTATVSNENKPSVKQTESNVASIVSDYYISTATLTDKQIDLLTLISNESDRYIQGIPRNISALKAMVNTAFGSSISMQADPLIDNWGNAYIVDFQKLKNSVDKYSSDLKKQKNVLNQTGNSLKDKYVPKSQYTIYFKEVDDYWKRIDTQVDIFNNTLNSLADVYLKDKSRIGEYIYQMGIENLQDQAVLAKAFTASYKPIIPSVPIYTPPIRTFCNSYGESISCTSYQN